MHAQKYTQTQSYLSKNSRATPTVRMPIENSKDAANILNMNATDEQQFQATWTVAAEDLASILFDTLDLAREDEDEFHHYVATSFEEKERLRLHMPPPSTEQHQEQHERFCKFLEANALKEDLLKQQQHEFERRRVESFDAHVRAMRLTAPTQKT